MPNPPATQSIAFRTARFSKTIKLKTTPKLRATTKVTFADNIARNSKNRYVIHAALKSWRLQYLQPQGPRWEYPVSEARIQTRVINVQDDTATVELTATLAPGDPSVVEYRTHIEASILVIASVEGDGDSDYLDDTDGEDNDGQD